MGKRSDSPRIDKDFYRTIDPRAVGALWPHIGHIRLFCEPCCGECDLAAALMSAGLGCVAWYDIQWAGVHQRKRDALSLTIEDLKGAQAIITNPPWSRSVLHPMIEHSSGLAETWLLFDADWAHTRQAALYMRDLCTHVVSVGRLIWIPGTKMTGKDNCAWYCFRTDKTAHTQFIGRAAA